MYTHINKLKSIYELSQMFIANNLQNLHTLIDFGARFGESYQYLKKFHPHNYIFVEPVQECVQKIRLLNFEKESNVYIYDCVFGNCKNTKKMFLFERDDRQSSNLFSDRQLKYGNVSFINVNQIEYSELKKFLNPVNNLIDFCKINVEGSEYDMIKDGFFHEYVNTFVLEAHNQHVVGKSWVDVVNSLHSSFELTIHGDLAYKYVMITGKRKV